jgi:hypothetical protein
MPFSIGFGTGQFEAQEEVDNAIDAIKRSKL